MEHKETILQKPATEEAQFALTPLEEAVRIGKALAPLGYEVMSFDGDGFPLVSISLTLTPRF